jgi:hypothetical protein
MFEVFFANFEVFLTIFEVFSVNFEVFSVNFDVFPIIWKLTGKFWPPDSAIIIKKSHFKILGTQGSLIFHKNLLKPVKS